MDGSPTPNWHPISRLPLIVSIIDEQLEGCEEQLRNLDPPGRPRPVLDDALVQRILRVFGEQMEMLPVFEEQLSRWKKGNATEKQRRELARLAIQLTRYREVLTQVLGLAEEHKEFTIEKVLARDDAEVGLDALLGKMDRWHE